eukprot:2911531-Pleurochrysis_carterae.AAC.1
MRPAGARTGTHSTSPSSPQLTHADKAPGTSSAVPEVPQNGTSRARSKVTVRVHCALCQLSAPSCTSAVAGSDSSGPAVASMPLKRRRRRHDRMGRRGETHDAAPHVIQIRNQVNFQHLYHESS